MSHLLLPWIDTLLVSIRDEFKQETPKWRWTTVSPADREYIHHIMTEPSAFASDAFIKEVMSTNPEPKKAVFGRISFILVAGGPLKIPLNLWFRIANVLMPKRPVRVILFGNLHNRTPPEHGREIEPIHINGGYTQRCNGKTIVIYRAEEATRVLVHELLHASCSDPNISVPFLEADTEAWAEVIYCGFLAKGVKKDWKHNMEEQIRYAVAQAESARRNHDVETAKQYGWRYLMGRINVWQQLGFTIPDRYFHIIRQYKSLRLTYKEPNAQLTKIE